MYLWVLGCPISQVYKCFKGLLLFSPALDYAPRPPCHIYNNKDIDIVLPCSESDGVEHGTLCNLIRELVVVEVNRRLIVFVKW